MHTLFAFCKWLQSTPLGASVRNSVWEFPVIETAHIFGIISLVGSTSILDLRMLGLAFKDDSVSKLAGRYLPWAWAGFVLQVITGFLLFSSEADKMYDNVAFRLKMLMIAMAGLNALVFHLTTYKNVEKWQDDAVAPFSARLAGTLSILLWFGIVAAGRWIAYV